MTAQPWYETLFSGLFIPAQLQMFPESVTKAEIGCITQVLQPQPGASILDVPCGHGRLTIPLAERGFQLTGVDRTGALLDEARKGAAQRQASVEWHQGDMRELPWEGRFDHAFCFGNSFAYFDDAGNRAFLQAVRKTLKPGGTFLLQTNLCAESVLLHPLGRRWYSFGDLICLHETVYDPATGQLTSTYQLMQGGKIEQTAQAVYQIHTYREIVGMVRDAGLEVQRTFGELEQEPFRLGSPGLCVLAGRV